MAIFNSANGSYQDFNKTLFEAMMLASTNGVAISNSNPLPVISGLGDAFGRSRVSNPLTLFDSFHRFADNGKFNTSNTATGTATFIANTASVDMTIDGTNGAYVYRESKKTFAYQPGKSLQILNTFVMNPAATGLRQRVGYFSSNNGIFLERSANTASGISMVKRSYVSGSVVDTHVDQSAWNVDKLDGSGPTRLTLNLDDPQILFIDMEWLGVGSVRTGFVINGTLVPCHMFHHSNLNAAPKGAYMQTACLPIRYEIENTSAGSGGTLKQICSTVISEGGYNIQGKPRSIGTDVQSTNAVQCSAAGTFYPIVSLRLHANALDGIVVPKQVGVLPISATNYRWKLVTGATIAGAVWANTSSDSIVQYNTNATATMSGGTDVNMGFISSTVQGGGSITITDGIFQYQLERNTFTSAATTFTLAVAAAAATSNVAGSITWEEVT